jgi:hypothetical protein
MSEKVKSALDVQVEVGRALERMAHKQSIDVSVAADVKNLQFATQGRRPSCYTSRRRGFRRC